MSSQNILIVEDESVIRSSLKKFLENHNYKVCEAGSVKEAAKHNLTAFSLIITDLRLPGASGADIIKLANGVPVLVMTSYASLRSAVETIKLGAVDYIPKPFDFNDLLATVNDLTRGKTAQADFTLLGECEEIRALSSQLGKVAPTDSNILIEGESGTGKALVARAIHQASHRADRQMVQLNCAAMPDAALKSGLFTDEQGNSAGEGADDPAKADFVDAADGGTLFLDEIGELPPGAQARLLRALQENEARKPSAQATQTTQTTQPVRLIATTHRNLQALVAEGSFRDDLYYRLNVVQFTLPPLRQRGSDVKLLAEHFLNQASEMYGKGALSFADDAIERICGYSWPGNVRELQNATQRAAILCDGSVISADMLALEERSPTPMPGEDAVAEDVSLENYFQKFVLENQDHMTETQIAQKLGISRKSLWQKRQKLNIPREKSRKR